MAFIQGIDPIERQKALEMQQLYQSIGQGLQTGIASYQNAQDRQRAIDAQKRQTELARQAQNLQDAQTFGQLSDQYKDVTPELVENLRSQGISGLRGLTQKPFEETKEGQKIITQRELEKQKELRGYEQQKQLKGIEAENALRLAKEKGELSISTKQPAQSEYTAAGFADRVKSSLDILNKPELIEAGASIRQSSLSKIPGVGNVLVSPEYQQYDQAARNFINATLRRESGAAISEGEFDNAYKQYLPKVGDSPQVLSQKKLNRETVLNSLQREGRRVIGNQPAQEISDPEFLAWKKSKGL